MHIGAYLDAFRANMMDAWKKKDAAIYLLTSILVGIVGGIIFGLISATIPYAATRGQRDFASTMQLVAGRYDVLCDPKSAEKARDMLARLAV